jgi:hypothetical protein
MRLLRMCRALSDYTHNDLRVGRSRHPKYTQPFAPIWLRQRSVMYLLHVCPSPSPESFGFSCPSAANYSTCMATVGATSDPFSGLNRGQHVTRACCIVDAADCSLRKSYCPHSFDQMKLLPRFTRQWHRCYRSPTRMTSEHQDNSHDTKQ